MRRRRRTPSGGATRESGSCRDFRRSVVVARNALALGDLLVLDRRLQHHAVGELVDDAALDLLPRRLVLRKLEAAVALQVGAAAIVLLPGDENVGRALVEVDPHLVAGLQDSEPAAGRSLRRRVEDRG